MPRIKGPRKIGRYADGIQGHGRTPDLHEGDAEPKQEVDVLVDPVHPRGAIVRQLYH
jgi:hypothetical protein